MCYLIGRRIQTGIDLRLLFVRDTGRCTVDISDNLLDRTVGLALYESGDGGFFRGLRELRSLRIMGFLNGCRDRAIKCRRRCVLTMEL